MGLLAGLFGESGLATIFFGGQWWLTGLFLIFILSMLMYGFGFGAESMAIFLFSAIILVTLEGLFSIPSDWIIIIIVFIAVLIGFTLNKFLRG